MDLNVQILRALFARSGPTSTQELSAAVNARGLELARALIRLQGAGLVAVNPGGYQLTVQGLKGIRAVKEFASRVSGDYRAEGQGAA